MRKKLKSLFNRFQLSWRQLYIMYLLIFGLPLIATVVLTEMAVETLEQQIQSSATAITQQVQTTIDSRLRDISRLIDQLNNHSTLRYILNSTEPLSASDRYKMTTVITDLRKQYANSSIVDNLFIYLPGTDSILTTSTRSTSGFFYEHYFRYEDVDYQGWMDEYMHAYNDMRIIPARAVYDGTQTRRLMTILQTLPRGETWSMSGTLALLIDENWLVSQVAAVHSMEGSEIFAVDASGVVVFGSAGASRNLFDLSLLSGNGLYAEETDGQTYQFSWASSTEQDWQYVFRYPYSQFFAKVDALRRTMWTALVAVVVIGLLLAGVMAYVSFMPVTNILITMRAADSTDMLGRLRRKITLADLGTLLEQMQKNGEVFSRQMPKLIENYVFKLIHGNRDVQAELSLLSEVLGFRFPSNVLAVLCFQMRGENEVESLSTYRETRPVVQALQGHEDAGMNLYITLAANDTIALLASFWAGQQEGYRELLERQALRLAEGIQARTGKRYAIGVSMVVDQYAEIEKCYRQAVMCVADAGEQVGPIFYADIARVVPPIDYSYPLETEKVLIGCVCTGDAKRMHKILEEIFVHHEQESRVSVDMVRCLKYDMLGTLYKCMNELLGDEQVEGQEQLAEKIRSIMESKDIAVIYSGFCDAFERLCTHAYRHRRSHNDSLCDKIIEYIRENYPNPDLGLDMVARAFDIAPGYLSRFFKEQTGGNFLDFINKLRVEHAASLLRTTDLPHSEIAVACGLSGAQALNRIFNRILSLSPSAYRQMAHDGVFDGQIIG